MIRPSDRKLARVLVAIRAFKVVDGRTDLFGCARLRPRKGGRWIWNWMKARQTPDDRKHAPACPANRWSGRELVLQPCRCRNSR